MLKKTICRGLCTLGIVSLIYQPIFASENIVLNNIQLKFDSISESKTINSETMVTQDDLFRGITGITGITSITNKTSTTNNVLQEDSLLSHIVIAPSNYLIERENEIKEIQNELSDTIFLIGTIEKPSYIYETNDENCKLLAKTSSKMVCEKIDDINEDDLWYHIVANDIDGYVRKKDIMVDANIYATLYDKANEYKKPYATPIEKDLVAILIQDVVNEEDGNIEDMEIEETIILSTNEQYLIWDEIDDNAILLINGHLYKIPFDKIVLEENKKPILELFSEYKQDIFDTLKYNDLEELFYIKTNYVDDVEKEPLIVTKDELEQMRLDMIEYASQFIGNAYIWGGTDLENGTDCSGYILRIYEHFGIDLPRVSYEQAKIGKQVSWNELLPGDLIFYDLDDESPEIIDHVAMFVGDRYIIHASNEIEGIKISKTISNSPRKIKHIRLFYAQ